MAIKMLVSKPGKDVLTSNSPDDFYLHSDYPLLKVHSYGTFSFNVAIGQTTVYHNLGYRPYVLVFSQAVLDDSGNVSSEYYQHDWTISGATVMWLGETRIYTDRIVIGVEQSNAARGGTVYGFYYIFKDEVT